MMTVDIYIASVVDPLEIDVGLFRSVACPVVEMFAIPGDTSRQVSGAARKVGGIRALYAPIVGQRKMPPSGIGIFRTVGILFISKLKKPSIIEFLRDSETYLCIRIHTGYEQARSHSQSAGNDLPRYSTVSFHDVKF